MSDRFRCLARERGLDQLPDARDVVRIDLDIAAAGDRENGTTDRTEIGSWVVRHVLAKPARGQVGPADSQDVSGGRLQTLPDVLLPAEEPPGEDAGGPAKRRGDPLRLPVHDLGAGSGRRAEQDCPGYGLAFAREPDSDRRTHRVADDRQSPVSTPSSCKPERIQRSGGIARLFLEARREVVARRSADAALVEAQRSNTVGHERRGKSAADVQLLARHV